MYSVSGEPWPMPDGGGGDCRDISVVDEFADSQWEVRS